ncbi:MAG TPA: alpha/beta hydrolase [Aridibacter sp.]|nr:alpha/beta hydrolase [Aridibacter sp.]
MRFSASARVLTVVILSLLFGAQASADSEPVSRFFETSDGATIHYLEAGTGPVILFVPGILVPAEVWANQIDYFSKDYRVIAMDPRSQGRSEKVTEGHFNARRGKDIGELAAHVSKEPVVVVSWSLAVWETLKYIKEHGSDRFRGVVLVDMWIGFDSKKPEPHPVTSGVALFVEGLQVDRKSWTRSWIKSFFQTPPPESLVDDLANRVMMIPTNSAVTLYANSLLIDDRDYRPVLNKIAVPLMMIMSTSDMAIAITKESRARWPDLRIETIPDTRHALFMEKPDEFNEILRRFIADLPKG